MVTTDSDLAKISAFGPARATILRTPKGWTAPGGVDGHKLEGFWRAHQIPIANAAKDPEHLKLLEHWMLSYTLETQR
jgi:phosphoketolase